MQVKPVLVIINGAQFGYSAGHYYYCKYLESDFKIHYICYDRGHKKMILNNIDVHYISFSGTRFLRILKFIRTSIKLSNQFKPDVLFVVFFNLCGLLPFFIKAKIKVLDIRTGSLDPVKAKRKFFNYLIKLQSESFNKITILSKSLLDELRLRNDQTLIMPLGAEIYNTKPINYNALNLLYIGTLDGRDLEKTVKGLSLFLKKRPEIKESTTYTIVGDGSETEKQKIINIIHNEDLGSVVKLAGRKNYTELIPYFENSNIGISFVPITDYYNLQPPTKTFEYILNGLFTIATETFENKSVITPSNGVLCNDSEIDFCYSLEFCYDNLNNFDSGAIRKSLSEYEWNKLVKKKLQPFIL